MFSDVHTQSTHMCRHMGTLLHQYTKENILQVWERGEFFTLFPHRMNAYSSWKSGEAPDMGSRLRVLVFMLRGSPRSSAVTPQCCRSPVCGRSNEQLMSLQLGLRPLLGTHAFEAVSHQNCTRHGNLQTLGSQLAHG